MPLRTITVGKLKTLLADEDDADLIAFSCSYGDRCDTEQVLGLRGSIELKQVAPSGYSESGYAVDEDYEQYAGCDDYVEPQEILILN